MRLPLFVYGTLCDTELRTAVLARALDARAIAQALAPGFRAARYPGRIYPALVRTPGASAPGLVLDELSAFELDLLDAFEGDEYQRETIPVIVEGEVREAEAYLPCVPVDRTAPEWQLADWQARHKAAVLPAERNAAEQIRIRLIAIRPN